MRPQAADRRGGRRKRRGWWKVAGGSQPAASRACHSAGSTDPGRRRGGVARRTGGGGGGSSRPLGAVDAGRARLLARRRRAGRLRHAPCAPPRPARRPVNIGVRTECVRRHVLLATDVWMGGVRAGAASGPSRCDFAGRAPQHGRVQGRGQVRRTRSAPTLLRVRSAARRYPSLSPYSASWSPHALQGRAGSRQPRRCGRRRREAGGGRAWGLGGRGRDRGRRPPPLLRPLVCLHTPPARAYE
jgi:hypothetical protein